MNKLISLAKVLSRLGLLTESRALSGLAKRASPPPLEGVVPLDKWEQPYFGGEEDEEGNPVERPVDRIKRQKKILRDKRNREALKKDVKLSPLPIEEQEEAELGEWYKAISAIGDSVILIPFDREDLEKNDEAIMGLGLVFGFHPRDYEELHKKVNMLSGSYREGNVDTFKSVFPALWADIQDILNDKKLSEDNVVFMLYDQQNSPVKRLEGFTKDPFYFGHDMGHNIFDSEDSDWEFKGIVNTFISNMYRLYMTEEDEESGVEPTSAYKEIEDTLDDDSVMMAQIGNFFGNYSGKEDSYGDVFQSAASGNLAVEVPDYLSLDEWYVLPEKNKVEAESLKNGVIESLKTYMNSNQKYGTKGSGPLAYFAGSVILNDI